MFELVNLHLQDRRQACQAMAGVGVGFRDNSRWRIKCCSLPLWLEGFPCLGPLFETKMLSKGGEAALHHQAVVFGVERTDVVLAGTWRQYKELCKRLRLQRFRCQLAELARSFGGACRRSLDAGAAQRRFGIGRQQRKSWVLLT